MSSSSGSDDDDITCGVAGCVENATEWTPCCHEPICEDCENKHVVPLCDNETCPNHDEYICEVCLGLNGKECEC